MNAKITIATIVFSALPFLLSAQSREISEENFLRLDSIFLAQFDRDTEPIFDEFEDHPERRDSLKRVYDDIIEIASLKNRELAIEFATVPSGLQRLYMVRLDIPKERLRSVFDALPEEMRSSRYGKNILSHLDSEQIEEGDGYYDFQATSDTGGKFKLSLLAGKNILFLYGGMDCMGTDGRNYLNALYERTSREDLEIVVYCLNSDLESLKNVRTVYPCDFFLVSDFLPDDTPVKIIYGAQATPTCFFIDKGGVVRMKTVGLNPDMVDELVSGDVE